MLEHHSITITTDFIVVQVESKLNQMRFSLNVDPDLIILITLIKIDNQVFPKC